MTVTTTPVWKLSLEAAAEGAVECGHLQSLHDLRLKGSRKFWICALSGPHGCRVNAEVTSYCALWSVSCSHRPGGLWVVAGIVLRGPTPLGVGRAPRLGPSKPLGPQSPMGGPSGSSASGTRRCGLRTQRWNNSTRARLDIHVGRQSKCAAFHRDNRREALASSKGT